MSESPKYGGIIIDEKRKVTEFYITPPMWPVEKAISNALEALGVPEKDISYPQEEGGPQVRIKFTRKPEPGSEHPLFKPGEIPQQ